MYLNVINYIVHVEHHVGCTVFVIDLQQAEVTNRVSDFFFWWPTPTNSMPPKTALDKMTNTTFPRVKRTSIVTVLILNSLSAVASSTSCFPSFSIMLQLISTRHFDEIKQDEMKTLRKKKTSGTPPKKNPPKTTTPPPPKKK